MRGFIDRFLDVAGIGSITPAVQTPFSKFLSSLEKKV